MPEQNVTEWATIGVIVAPFGVHGELKVRLVTDIPGRFAELDAVHVGPEHTRYPIKSVRPYKGEMIVLKLDGVDDANTAETLRNLDLQIPESKLATLPPGSYYQHDILGLHVITMDGQNLGHITDIMVTGSNDVYSIETPGGKQVLIPAIKDVIKQIDLVSRTMYIDPLPGLLDEDQEQEGEEPEEL